MKKLVLIIALLLIGLPANGSMVWLPQVGNVEAGVVIAPVGGGGSTCNTDNDSELFAIGNGNNSRTVSGSTYRGQTFDSKDATSITEIHLRCRDYSSDTGSTTLHFYAYDETNDEPTGSELGSVTVNNSALPDSWDWHVFTFASSVSVSTNTQYCYYLSTADGGATYLGFDDVGTAYADGVQLYSSDSGSNWSEETSRDLYCAIYGCE